MKVKIPACSHPLCKSRMKRCYIQVPDGTRYKFSPIGWVCPVCKQFKPDPSQSPEITGHDLKNSQSEKVVL